MIPNSFLYLIFKLKTFTILAIKIHYNLPFSSSMSAGIIPDLASNAAQESSMDTVPIIITTSKTRSSSAAPNKVKSQEVFKHRKDTES